MEKRKPYVGYCYDVSNLELTLTKTAGKALFEEFSPSLPLISHQRQLAAIVSLLDKILTYASLADVKENSGWNVKTFTAG